MVSGRIHASMSPMTGWAFRAWDEAAAYLTEVRDEMLLLFDITIAEAEGRINRHYANRDLTDSVSTDVLLHEEQDVIARHVYYGRDSFWWL